MIVKLDLIDFTHVHNPGNGTILCLKIAIFFLGEHVLLHDSKKTKSNKQLLTEFFFFLLKRKKEFEQRQKEFDSSLPSVSTSTSVPKQKWSKDSEDKSKFIKQSKVSQPIILPIIFYCQTCT